MVDGRIESDSPVDLTAQVKGTTITWPVGDISPKITYDVNGFLNHAGMEIFVNSFLTWCRDHHVQGSMEPYGFTTDILEGAGAVDLPFMEVTPGEKDAVPWFDARTGPKKYVASGADLCGRNVIGVEAYAFIHWEIYRATLEELKIASDGFFCAGANQFYNHLYCYTPVREAAPSRVPRISGIIKQPNGPILPPSPG